MQLFTGSIPQSEPLTCSIGRAQTRGCVYLKSPIPKLSVPIPKLWTEPTRITCHPLPAPQLQRSLELSPLSSLSDGPLLPSTSPSPPRKRSREDPWQLPVLPALSSLLNFGAVGTSVLISHQCWRGGTIAAPASANIGPLCLLRAGGTDKSPQDLSGSSSPMCGWL